MELRIQKEEVPRGRGGEDMKPPLARGRCAMAIRRVRSLALGHSSRTDMEALGVWIVMFLTCVILLNMMQSAGILLNQNVSDRQNFSV